MTSIQHDEGGTGGAGGVVRSAEVADLDPVTLYAILRLRVDVFVVEQDCPYPELDGRDLEPGARQLWIERDGGVQATLRMLTEADDTVRIGRVATSVDARGAGLAAMLMHEAMTIAQDRDIMLNAQAHLEHWYARFGFVRAGENFDEDGIPHVPMLRSHTLPS